MYSVAYHVPELSRLCCFLQVGNMDGGSTVIAISCSTGLSFRHFSGGRIAYNASVSLPLYWQLCGRLDMKSLGGLSRMDALI